MSVVMVRPHENSFYQEHLFNPSHGELAKMQEVQARATAFLDGSTGEMDSLDSPYSGGVLPVGPEVELFANALDDCLTTHGSAAEKRARIFRLVDIYYSRASANFVALRHRLAKGASKNRASGSATMEDNDMDLDEAEEDTDSTTQSNDLAKWEKEMQTWDLLRRLLPLRYPEHKGGNQPGRIPKPVRTSGNLWAEFLDDNPLVVERMAILEWLQQNAAVGPDIDELVRDLQQSADRGDIIAHGWLHTRSAIKLRKNMYGSSHLLDYQSPEIARSHVNSTNSPLVTELDPDAVTRQDRRLEPQDEYFERAIWVGCFQLLRRGSSLDQIRDWCLERTEVWRAVTMSALPLSSQPGESTLGNNADSLALWRRMCFALARHGGSDDIERAVYGLLSGDIPSVEKVCKTWDDFMFMHYNALIRTQFDLYVLSKCQPDVSASISQNFAVFDAIQFHGDVATLEKRLFASLEANNNTSAEAIDPMKQLQAAIIAKELDRHIYQQGVILTREANRFEPSDIIPDDTCPDEDIDARKFMGLRNHEGIRVAVHVSIILSSLDALGLPHSNPAILSPQPDRRGLQENVVAVYASILRLAGLEELIPLYCSKIRGPQCFQVLSNNILQITDRDARIVQLNLIRKAGLDVLKFVKLQPQYIFKKLNVKEPLFSTQRQFRIMEVVAPSIKYGRPIKTDFFGEDPDRIDRHDEQLIRTVEWLLLVDEAWADVFVVGAKVYKYFLKHMRLNAARSFSVRVPFHEVIRQKAGLTVQDDLDPSWFEDLDFWASQDNTPGALRVPPRQVASDARVFRELECLVKALDTMETLASLAELSREDPSAKRDFWSKVGNEVKAAKDYVRPLLKDWLLAQEDDGDLQDLRDTYLPETILAYVSTLHFAGTSLSRDNLLECMDLAAVIAEKDSDIAACFVKANRMKELVEAFASCSKALAIMTGEKKTTGSSSKKLREMGWSRDLWSVKP